MTHVNIIKAMYNKPITNIMVSEKTSVYSVQFNTELKVLATAIRQEKEIKGIQVQKKGKD